MTTGTIRHSIRAILLGAVLVTASVFLGIATAAVNAPCMRPYAECVGHGHAGQAFAGLALIVLTVIVGLAGLVCLLIAASIAVARHRAASSKLTDPLGAASKHKSGVTRSQGAERRPRCEDAPAPPA
jgi:hypothetical protein